MRSPFLVLVHVHLMLISYDVAEVATATGEFSQSVSELGASDVDQQLAAGLVGLGEVEKTAQDLQNSQSQEDTVTIMSTGRQVSM